MFGLNSDNVLYCLYLYLYLSAWWSKSVNCHPAWPITLPTPIQSGCFTTSAVPRGGWWDKRRTPLHRFTTSDVIQPLLTFESTPGRAPKSRHRSFAQTTDNNPLANIRGKYEICFWTRIFPNLLAAKLTSYHIFRTWLTVWQNIILRSVLFINISGPWNIVVIWEVTQQCDIYLKSVLSLHSLPFIVWRNEKQKSPYDYIF